jgi:O-antigen/teichoic acid export membrane protein
MWLRQHPPVVIIAARFCLLSTVLNSMTLVGRAAWEARGDFRSSNLSQVAAPAMTIVGLVGLAATGHLTSVTAAIAYVAVSVPVLLWMLAGLRSDHPLTPQALRTEWGQLLHYGARSYGVDLFGVLAVYLDQALVVGMLPPVAMGIYAVALSLSRIISAVHIGLATLMLPAVVGYPADALTAAIARSARLAAVVAAAIGLAIVAAGPLLVKLLYGSAYASAGALLPILVLVMIVGGTTYVLMQGLLAAGRPGIVTLTQLVGLVLSVPFFLVLVPASGPRGAAIALLVSVTIRLALVMACYPLWLRAPLPRLWINRTDLADLIGRASSLLRMSPAAWLRTGAAE